MGFSLVLLIIGRIVQGIGYALASTATMTIVQSIIPASRRAEGTGYFALGSTMATALGPALGLFLVESFTYNILFWVTLGTAVLGLVLGGVLHQHPNERAAAAAHQTRPPRFSLRAIVAPQVIPIGCFMLLAGVSYSGVLTYLLSYSEERNVARRSQHLFPRLRGRNVDHALRARTREGPPR